MISTLILVQYLVFLNKTTSRMFLSGGYRGQLKRFCDESKEHGIAVTLVVTKKGKDLGYGSNQNIPEITTEKYFEKKSLLLSSSNFFVFLPTQKLGLGLLSEIIDLLEYSLIYCNIVKLEPPKILFMGQPYETTVGNILKQTGNTSTPNIEYAN